MAKSGICTAKPVIDFSLLLKV